MPKEIDLLPFYSVERGFFPQVPRGQCPVCQKRGRWAGDVFLPADERQPSYPRCYCATIHRGGGFAYDPATRTVLVRARPQPTA